MCVNAHCDIQIQPAFSVSFHSSTVFRAVLNLNPPVWYTADTAMCSTNSVILRCVVETLEQVLLCYLTRASISCRSIFEYTLGNKGLFVAILGNHTYKVTVNALSSEKKTVSK